MSTEHAPIDGLSGDIRILTEESCLEYDLGGDYRLEVAGNPGADGRPLTYTVVGEHERESHQNPLGSPISTFEPRAEIFDSGALLDRYVGVVAALAGEDAAARFRDVVDELGEEYSAGALFVIRESFATVVKSTQRVEFLTDKTQPVWRVYFTDDHVNHDWGVGRVDIPLKEWLDTEHPYFNLPSGMALRLQGYPDRWRTLRLIWTMMYARDEGAEIFGEKAKN